MQDLFGLLHDSTDSPAPVISAKHVLVSENTDYTQNSIIHASVLKSSIICLECHSPGASLSDNDQKGAVREISSINSWNSDSSLLYKIQESHKFALLKCLQTLALFPKVVNLYWVQCDCIYSFTDILSQMSSLRDSLGKDTQQKSLSSFI